MRQSIFQIFLYFYWPYIDVSWKSISFFFFLPNFKLVDLYIFNSKEWWMIGTFAEILQTLWNIQIYVCFSCSVLLNSRCSVVILKILGFSDVSKQRVKLHVCLPVLSEAVLQHQHMLSNWFQPAEPQLVAHQLWQNQNEHMPWLDNLDFCCHSLLPVPQS